MDYFLFFFGALSDRIARRNNFLIGYIALIVWAIPTWILIDSGSTALFAVAVIVQGLLIGIIYGPQPALYAELFPAHVRLSGMSIGYALGSILEATGNSLYIGVYIASMSLLSFIFVLFVPRGIQGRDLRV